MHGNRIFAIDTYAVVPEFRQLNPIIHDRANFKDLYLCNEYSYCKEIRLLFIKCIEEDNGVLISPVSIKTLPWQPLFRKPFYNFQINFLGIYFYFKYFYSNA